MVQSVQWIITLAVFALIGVAGTLYFRIIVMRRDEVTAGLAALAAMSWREFIHLVLDFLAQRGYTRVFDRQSPSGDDDYTLERDGKHSLLTCKHGSAYVLGSAAVTELGNAIRLANAAGGILATQGRIADEAKPGAALQRIELLDGPTLWPQLRGLIKPQQLADILEGADSKAKRRTALSWLLALVAAIATFMVLPGSDRPMPATTVAGVAPTTMSTTTTPSSAAPTPPAAADAGKLIIAAPAPTDAAALAVQRNDVAAMISALPMVDRAVWATQSTLQVYLLDASTDAMPHICPLIERYDALASSRMQLTPPAGSAIATRFRQCRSY